MAVVIASRLCSTAAGGEVLVQDLVGALVSSRDGVSLERMRVHELKGVPARVHAASLRWRKLVPRRSAVDLPDGGGDGAASRPGIPLPRALAAYAREPLIGRDREIAALREATAPRHGCRVALVLGEPGIGKTRHAAAAAADAQARGAAVKDATNVRRTAQQYCRSPRAGKPQHRSRGDQVDSPESLV